MAKKNPNPYRDGSNYAKIFDIVRKMQIVTRAQVIEAAIGLGMTATAAAASVTVVLSPRAEGSSTRGGDCRGNMSAKGEFYFMDKLKKKKGEAQRFRLRWRKTLLEPLVRPVKVEKASKKTKAKSKAKVKDSAEVVEA